jgi:hypothetical protein
MIQSSLVFSPSYSAVKSKKLINDPLSGTHAVFPLCQVKL